MDENENGNGSESDNGRRDYEENRGDEESRGDEERSDHEENGENDGAVRLYGEPFDSAFALAEEHQLAADLAAARAVYEESLTVAESIEDSPDVRFLRAHLLSNIASVQLTATDPAGAADAVERALGLLHGISSVPMGPVGRQLWLEVLLKTLLAKSDLLRMTGYLDEALACLDEVAVTLPEFHDPEGLRTAELGLNRVNLLIERGEWGAAEEQTSALLATTPTTAGETIPRLLTAHGLICASTGRFDLAEDCFTRAENAFRAMGDTGEQQSLLAHRAYSAMLRGDLDLAERLYAEASAIFERQRQFGALAVCEQARGFLAGVRGDPSGGEVLLEASLGRFERLGASIAAADTNLLGAQQAYDRGDITEMKRLAQAARDVYQERNVYERCAQVDLMLARTIEDNLNRTDHGDHGDHSHHVQHVQHGNYGHHGDDCHGYERQGDDCHRADGDHPDRVSESIGTAISLALPAALALEAARYDFVTAHARSQWLQLADEAMQLVFRLVVRRQDQGLLFELVEHRCAGATLVLNRTPPSATPASPSGSAGTAGSAGSAEGAPWVFPNAAMKAYGQHRSGGNGGDGGDGGSALYAAHGGSGGHTDGPMALGGVAAEAAASAGLRVAPPPRVRMSPESGRVALQEYIAAAEFRYHRKIVSEEEVSFWSPTT